MEEPTDILDELGQPKGSTSLKEVLYHLMVEFGGPAEFARLIKLDYDNNPPGAVNRIRIASDLMRMLLSSGEETTDEGLADAETLAAMEKELAKGDSES